MKKINILFTKIRLGNRWIFFFEQRSAAVKHQIHGVNIRKSCTNQVIRMCRLIVIHLGQIIKWSERKMWFWYLSSLWETVDPSFETPLIRWSAGPFQNIFWSDRNGKSRNKRSLIISGAAFLPRKDSGIPWVYDYYARILLREKIGLMAGSRIRTSNMFFDQISCYGRVNLCRFV